MSAPGSAVFAATVFVELLNNYCLSPLTFIGTVNNNLKKASHLFSWKRACLVRGPH